MRTRWTSVLFAGALSLLQPIAAQAADARPRSDEASVHYRRGVTFFEEKSYAAALAEFRRAYEIAPKPQVLYNIGQIQMATHDDAAALRTFERYLADAGSSLAPTRKTEVLASIARLRDRVGYIDATSDAPDGEIAIDDAVVAHIPLTDPILVRAGRHHVTLIRDGHEVTGRSLEVAAGDHAAVALNLPLAAPPPTRPRTAEVPMAPPPPPDALPRRRSSAALWASWAAAGTLGVGTAVTGALALQDSSVLATARRTEGVSRQTLNADQLNTKTMALVADILGASTIVGVGVATWISLSRGTREPAPTVSVTLNVTPTGAVVFGSF